MQSNAQSPEAYLETLPEERKAAVAKLRDAVRNNLPEGFTEGMGYGMLGYAVPHSLYPSGYHCNPKLPLPFISIASQKNFVALYHMGIYADKNLLDWFISEYPKHAKGKLDMGKGCIRFKKTDDIPYRLVAELASKVTVDEWITCYENVIKKK
ncbi:MAG TPA: DUF1801 domain-containing protein [Flavobacterium sp.]